MREVEQMLALLTAFPGPLTITKDGGNTGDRGDPMVCAVGRGAIGAFIEDRCRDPISATIGAIERSNTSHSSSSSSSTTRGKERSSSKERRGSKLVGYNEHSERLLWKLIKLHAAFDGSVSGLDMDVAIDTGIDMGTDVDMDVQRLIFYCYYFFMWPRTCVLQLSMCVYVCVPMCV
jgi:hypothetical protein